MENERTVARNIFNHGQDSVEKLKAAKVVMPDEIEYMVRYHHDHSALKRALEIKMLEGAVNEVQADRIKKLAAILIVADAFEQGNNYHQLVGLKGASRVENLKETVEGWIRHRFDVMERIGERGALEALKRLISREDKALFDTVLEARRTKSLMPEDEAYIEELKGLTGKEKDLAGMDRGEILAMYRGDYVSAYASRAADIARLLTKEMGLYKTDPGLADDVQAAVLAHDTGGSWWPIDQISEKQLYERLRAKGVYLPDTVSRDEKHYMRVREMLYSSPEGTFTPLEMAFATDMFQGPN